MGLHRVRHNWMDEHTQSNRTGVLIRKENEDADTYPHKGHSPARGTLTCTEERPREAQGKVPTSKLRFPRRKPTLRMP